MFDSEQPVSSLLLFVLHPTHLDLSRRSAHLRKAISERHLQLLPIARRLVEGGAVVPLDDFVADRKWDVLPEGEKFRVPLKEYVSNWQWVVFLTAIAADGFAPWGTWPGLLTQNFALAKFKGNAVYVTLAIQEIAVSENYGPICNHLMSKLSAEVESPELSAWFAERGLQKNSLEMFRRDYHALLDDRVLCGQLCLSIADAVRTLDESEVQVLSSVTTPHVDVLLTELRKNRESPIEAVLPAALDVMYEAKFQEVLTHLLTKLKREAATRQKEQEDLKKLNDQANQGLRDLLQ